MRNATGGREGLGLVVSPQAHQAGATFRTCAARPLLDSVRISRYDPPVSNAWPPLGPQKREPLLEHVCDLWNVRYVETNCTATSWWNDFGLELRVGSN